MPLDEEPRHLPSVLLTSLGIPHGPNLEVPVRAAYALALDRAPTEVEHAVAAGRLQGGVPWSTLVNELRAVATTTAVEREALDSTVGKLHRNELGRTPTDEEAVTWTSRVRRDADLADLLRAISPAGDRTPDHMRADPVVSALRAISGRTPTPTEAAKWAEHAEATGSLRHLIAALLTAPAAAAFREARMVEHASSMDQAHPGRPASDMETRTWRNAEAGNSDPTEAAVALNATRDHATAGAASVRRTVVAIFEACVLRQPTQAEFHVWVPALQRDMSPAECFLQMSRSAEARELGHDVSESLELGDDPLPRAVSVAYAMRLRRQASPDERDRWCERLRAGLPFEALLASLTEAALSPALTDIELRDIISMVYRASLARRPAASEIDAWIKHLRSGLRFSQMMAGIENSDEALGLTTSAFGPDLDNAEFVCAAYDIVLQQGITGPELESRQDQLGLEHVTRSNLVRSFFNQVLSDRLAAQPSHGPTPCWIMGTTRMLDQAGWEAALDASRSRPAPPLSPLPRFNIISEPGVLVSAIASLYCGGKYLDVFLDNITSQTIFKDYAELIIIDAASPEGEARQIREVMQSFPNIRYFPINYRIGVYDAWNVGIEAARGAYITNTNLDDLRRADSLEVQASVLDNLPFVDVTYQNFYYTFDWRMTFEDIARVGLVSDLPVITPHNMLRFNSPHNAPMWRRALHDELGLFDVTYKSAGDYDFWLRCVAAGKTFYKINDPHVVYYHNPEGVSTRAGTMGFGEVRRIARRYGPLTSAPGAMESKAALATRLLPTGTKLEPTLHERGRYAIVQAGMRHLATQVKASHAIAEHHI